MPQLVACAQLTTVWGTIGKRDTLDSRANVLPG
jgi:hypothetical protein